MCFGWFSNYIVFYNFLIFDDRVAIHNFHNIIRYTNSNKQCFLHVKYDRCRVLNLDVYHVV